MGNISLKWETRLFFFLTRRRRVIFPGIIPACLILFQKSETRHGVNPNKTDKVHWYQC